MLIIKLLFKDDIIVFHNTCILNQNHKSRAGRYDICVPDWLASNKGPQCKGATWPGSPN